jgi:hypothetical protein
MSQTFGFIKKGFQGPLTGMRQLARRCHCFFYIFQMEQYVLKNVNNCLNTNISSYLETSGGQGFSLYLNVVHLFNTSVN